MTHICVFGDSIAWGSDDHIYLGWVYLLRRYIESKNSDIEIYNLSISGDDTKNLLKRIETEAHSRQTNTIIFAIGINDSIFNKKLNRNQTSLISFKNNIKKLIEKSKKYAKDIVFIGLTKVNEALTTPISWDTDKYYKNEIIKKYDNTLKNIAKEHNLKYINMFDTLIKSDLEDGLHPNTLGHNKMFEKIKKNINIIIE